LIQSALSRVSADELIIAINISHYLALSRSSRLDEVRSAARQMLSVLRGIDAAGAAAAASAAAFRQRASATTRLRRFIRRALV